MSSRLAGNGSLERAPTTVEAVAGRGVGSVEISGRLLAALAASPCAMMLRDLAAAAALAPAQAHAYLVSLRKIGLVERDPSGRSYQLGPFAQQIGLARMHAVDPVRLAVVGARALAAELGMLVSLAVWSRHGAVVMHLQEGPSMVPANLAVGGVVPLLTSAMGRLFVAYGPPEETRALLRRELSDPPASDGAGLTLADMEAGAAAVRQRGYAAARDKPVPGVSALSAPVLGTGGRLELAVTAMGRNGTVDLGPESHQIAALRRFTDALSSRNV